MLFRYRYGVAFYCVQSVRAISIGWNVGSEAAILHAINLGANAGGDIACNTGIGC